MAKISQKREKLLDAAKTLIHKQGFHRTTLADIAEESEVPLGNVYYYFKTKEDILEEVLQQRWQKLQETFACCCHKDKPRENLVELVKTISKSSAKVAEYGCVIGSLCQELDKTQLSLRKTADRIMQEHIEWTSKQFKQMGYENSRELGFELIARIEGTMLLGHAMQKPRLIKKQLQGICDWINSL